MLRSLARVFAIDLRSLALFRIALGGVFVWDVLGRVPDLRAHYSETGVLPVALAARMQTPVYWTPFAWLSGEPTALALLFALMGAAGLMLVLGYRTRIASAACWLLLALLHMRNNMVYFGGDNLLRVVLFWSMFVPLGARWSLDARRARDVISDRFVSLGSAGLLLQIATVYWVTGLSKTDPAWRDGTAVWYALNFDLYVGRYGIWLREHAASLLPLLTHATLAVEIFAPCLAFSPIWNGPLRTAVVALLTSFHLGLWFALDISFFQALSITAWLVFLPSWFWDDLLPRLGLGSDVREPGGRALSAPRWLEAVVVVPLAFVVLFTSFTAGGLLIRGECFELPGPIATVGRLLRLNQSWIMFRDFGDRRDFWLVADGTLADGRHVDPYRRAPLSWTKDEPLAERLRSLRWRQVVRGVLNAQPPNPNAVAIHTQFAEYLCREWNAEHGGDEQIEQLSLVVMQEQTTPESVVPLDPMVRLRHRCGREGLR